MDIKVIIEELVKSHGNFSNFVSDLSETEYQFSYQEKWNAGQHLDHIIKSVSILATALSLPKFILKSKFGKANRVSKTPEALIEKYLEKLKTAKPTPSRFQPKEITFLQKEKAVKELHRHVKKLYKKALKFSENELDEYILPHPLFGKLTIREMLYFTNYHVKHHKELIINSLNR